MRTIALAGLLILCGTTLLAQYPKGEKIQPYPVPVIERILLQRFDSKPENAAQWKALHQAVLTPLAKTIQIESSGHDPYIMLPTIEYPKTGSFEFRIRIKNNMNPPAEIFWATEKEPHFQANNAVRFDFLPENDWHTYTIEFATTEPLTRLRFDPGASSGGAEIDWVELYEIIHGDMPEQPTPWVDSDWMRKVKNWKTISSENLLIKFDEEGGGATILRNNNAVGEIYPLVYHNSPLPLGGVKHIPFYREPIDDDGKAGPIALTLKEHTDSTIEFALPDGGTLVFGLKDDELRFALKSNTPVFGPAFRPYSEMKQALLCGVEYLEHGEHSSSTADITTKEHLRFAPSPMDITWQFMSVVTDHAAFGLVWNEPDTQPIFAVPDIILGDSTKHHLGLYGKKLSGTLKIAHSKKEPETERYSVQSPEGGTVNTPLDELILWAFQKHGGAPDLPQRLRNDEEQRLLNLAAFEQSCIVDSNGNGWYHAANPSMEKQFFPVMYGSDFVTAIWQLTGTLPTNLSASLGHGGGHLPNPASFFLLGDAENFRTWKRNESAKIRSEQRPDGSFPYSGKYQKGHWEDTASGHCGYKLFQLLHTYQILGEPEALTAALKGLEFANKYTVPRGAQTWELSLHTPDIMGASRMCMANVWAYEATGEKRYLEHARRWAITGLPFIYLWENKPMGGKENPIMLYATIPVFGATDWIAPNWIGLPVQWCGLDYAEACFMLAKHDLAGTPVNWQKIAEGILITAERMQYTEGPSIGLLPDAYKLETQIPLPFDINPSVLVQQRRRLQGKIPALDIALSADGEYRVVSPYRTVIVGNVAVIEGVSGTVYQIIVNGRKVKTIESQGIDRVKL